MSTSLTAETFLKYGSPIVYYSANDKTPPEGILADLENCGYPMNEDNLIKLNGEDLGLDEKTHDLLPFIYFPAEAKVHCKYGTFTFQTVMRRINAPSFRYPSLPASQKKKYKLKLPPPSLNAF